ncbi:hypothetical protein TMPK1_19230 [Rhodospirillales bacterium TMPK1]|uniref:Uncharacterized protein n=2 Tax=Roseiterribacter gracilis TaxID=2812848 RepID=A0A8S8XEL7_9PROT|nr:hypothetical protein TMPK1_19230 [Rhodospirillales bacterium TMPK1]
MGAFLGGTASLAGAVYTQRRQNRAQRIEREITRRETVYAEFIMCASNLLVDAYTRDEIAIGGHEQKLMALMHRIQLFAPPHVISAAEDVIHAIIEIALQPSVPVHEFVKSALSKNPDPDALVAFSRICRADLDSVHAPSREQRARGERNSGDEMILGRTTT